MIAIRRLTAMLGAQGFREGASQLSRTQLVGFFMGASHADERAIRAMLRSWDTGTGGLSSKVRDLMGGRSFNAKPRARPLDPYTEHEWSRLIAACQKEIDVAFAAHRAALAAARRGDDPESPGWTPTPDNVRRLLAARGPMPARDVAQFPGPSERSQRLLSRGFREAHQELFPEPGTMIAYQLLFGAYTGVVPDGIEALA